MTALPPAALTGTKRFAMFITDHVKALVGHSPSIHTKDSAEGRCFAASRSGKLVWQSEYGT